jgi:hypothetical protein
MTETEATTEILDRIGSKHYSFNDTLAWWIPSPEGKGSVSVVLRDDKWKCWSIDAYMSGFEMLEALAGLYPFIADKLAEPIK